MVQETLLASVGAFSLSFVSGKNFKDYRIVACVTNGKYVRFVLMLKRVFDIMCALFGLIVLLPVFFFIAILIKLDDGGTIVFQGTRIGRYGKKFLLIKFRTMRLDADKKEISSTPDDDPRITRMGKFLRRYKLDELPQLLNVLKGDMSLVGPRPQVAWAVALYDEKEKQLLSLRPGITDYASIRFRNEGAILRGSSNPDEEYLEKIAPEKIRLGLEYVRDSSFVTDLKIILATLYSVVGGDSEKLLGKMLKKSGAISKEKFWEDS